MKLFEEKDIKRNVVLLEINVKIAVEEGYSKEDIERKVLNGLNEYNNFILLDIDGSELEEKQVKVIKKNDD